MTFVDRRKELLSVKNDERNLKEEFKEDAESPIFWLKVRKAFPLTAGKSREDSLQLTTTYWYNETSH